MLVYDGELHSISFALDEGLRRELGKRLELEQVTKCFPKENKCM